MKVKKQHVLERLKWFNSVLDTNFVLEKCDSNNRYTLALEESRGSYSHTFPKIYVPLEQLTDMINFAMRAIEIDRSGYPSENFWPDMKRSLHVD